MATPVKRHPAGPADFDDEATWDDLIEGVLKAAHEDVRVEQARLRTLGIIDADGSLLKTMTPHKAPVIDNGSD